MKLYPLLGLLLIVACTNPPPPAPVPTTPSPIVRQEVVVVKSKLTHKQKVEIQHSIDQLHALIQQLNSP